MAFLDVTGLFLIVYVSFSFQESLGFWVLCVWESSLISLHSECVQTKFHVKEIAMEIIKHVLHKL